MHAYTTCTHAQHARMHNVRLQCAHNALAMRSHTSNVFCHPHAYAHTHTHTHAYAMHSHMHAYACVYVRALMRWPYCSEPSNSNIGPRWRPLGVACRCRDGWSEFSAPAQSGSRMRRGMCSWAHLRGWWVPQRLTSSPRLHGASASMMASGTLNAADFIAGPSSRASLQAVQSRPQPRLITAMTIGAFQRARKKKESASKKDKKKTNKPSRRLMLGAAGRLATLGTSHVKLRSRHLRQARTSGA